METRIHSTCGHARASTARPRGMEINIKSNSGKDLRGGAISLATHGSGSPPVPETEAPKKAPQRHLEPKCAPGCVAGVSRVCRAVFNSAPAFLSSLSHPSLLSAHAGIYIFPLTPDQPPL